MRTDISTILSSTPHFALSRKGVPEVVISGVGYFKVEAQQIQGSDPSIMLVARSLLKPWQFIAADVGGEDSIWALGLASHSGQAHHMEYLHKLGEIAHAGEDELFCPRDYPLDPAVSSMMRNSGVRPTRMQHPCSGKHLVALAACRAHDFPVDKYWDVDHPLQKRVANMIGQQVGEKPIWMTDSCGLPTIAITARAHLNMWERLVTNDDPKYKRLRELWTRNIRLVGGYGRLESDLMEVAPGRILAKEGADGLLMVASIPTPNEPAAVCFVKLASGYSVTYLALALWSTLSRATDLPPAFQSIVGYLKSRLEQWVPRDQELVLPPFA